MSTLTQWDLYGKDLSGHPLPAEAMEPLCDRLEELADEYYTAECLGSVDESELICALMTDYSSAYEELVNTVTEFSKSLPDAVLQLFYDNTDTRLTARKKPFGVGCFPKIYVSFTYPIPLPYGGGNIGVNTPVARVGEAVSSI